MYFDLTLTAGSVAVFIHHGTVTLTWILPIPALNLPEKPTEVLGGGVKSLGIGETWEGWGGFFLHSSILWQMPVSVCVSMSGYRRCQSTFWHQKKGLPSPTTLAHCPFPSNRCQFQSASPLWICEDIFSQWMADWQINILMSLPTELQRRLTWSMHSKC